MRLVIDIPDKDYEFVRDIYAISCGRMSYKGVQANVINAIKQGTPYNPQGEWIPVSERLPDESDWYLVTRYDSRGYRITDMTSYNISSKEFSRDVIAWQPLPEPYKEGGAK